jgi:hypothetical protein
MPDVPEHVDGVLHCHQEIVELVQLGLVSNHVVHEHWEEFTLPVKESAACSLLYVGFPVGNEVKLCIPVVDLLQFL